MLSPVAAEGTELETIPAVRLGEGVVGKSALSGENFINPAPSDDPAALREAPLVVIALKIKEQVIGVVTIYSLLQQKKSFSSVDHELFTLLAGHAATAIFSSRLYSESRRKLSTYKNFVDLLSKPEGKEK
jgi:GAF domain-containing protein